MKLGFIGTGHIGNPMAKNLIKAGHQLVVHDLREETAANLIELGATWAGSPRAVAEQCQVVFMSLPGPPEVQTVMLGHGGVLEGASAGTVVFDLSSNAPQMVRLIGERAREQGVTFLDSPVSGGVTGAEKATLAVMVGGDRAAFDAHRELLDAIGSNVFHLGELGAGSVVKLMNNMVNLVFGLVMDEALVTGLKAGIAPELLHQVLSVSSAGALVDRMPGLFRRRFDAPTFTLTLGAKDCGLAVAAGRELGVPMPVAAAAEQVYLWAKGLGLGDKAPAAALLVYERAAGVEVHPEQSSRPA